ncbi:MAG: bifunctional UDP-N-acetylglucosamine diphosphorylase/glucosamine-1-phosphate N-acetyltransferase GlmU [Bacillota bacterium]
MQRPWAVILAAGEGTRMHSSMPKVLHPLCGRPMLWYVLQAARAVTEQQLVVVGYGSEQIKEYFGEDFFYVEQRERLGTGHALLQTLARLPQTGELLVLCGDTPLLQAEILQRLLEHHRRARTAATVLTAEMTDPSGYGRVLRDHNGAVREIVEDLHATAAQQAVREINTGAYCFDLAALKRRLPSLSANPEKKEYYLTDLLPLLTAEGHRVEALMLGDAFPALGINDRAQLARATACLRERINGQLMREGVTMLDPATTYIDWGVKVGRETVIYPQTILEGATEVGEGCLLGPGTHLIDSILKDAVTCRQSTLWESTVEEGARIGPYAYLRPGSVIGPGAKIGDFVEIKNSTIGRGSKIPHLSYVGDATVGSGVNMGAGSIVVNYDGRHKHRTNIEEGAFIGCNSNLVAPLTIGAKAFIGAGSTITRHVPPGSLALSRSPQQVKEGLARRFLEHDQEK